MSATDERDAEFETWGKKQWPDHWPCNPDDLFRVWQAARAFAPRTTDEAAELPLHVARLTHPTKTFPAGFSDDEWRTIRSYAESYARVALAAPRTTDEAVAEVRQWNEGQAESGGYIHWLVDLTGFAVGTKLYAAKKEAP